MNLKLPLAAIRVDPLYECFYDPPTPEEYERLRTIIKTHGFSGPIEVEQDPEHPDKYVVLDGHQRLKIVTELGYTMVDCVVARTPQERYIALTRNLNRRQLNQHTVKQLLERTAVLEKTIFQSTFDVFVKQLLELSDDQLTRLASLIPSFRHAVEKQTESAPETSPPATSTPAEAEAKRRLEQAERAMRKLIKEKEDLEAQIERYQQALTQQTKDAPSGPPPQLIEKYERELEDLRQRLVEQSHAVKAAQEEAARARDAIETARREKEAVELRLKVTEDELYDQQQKTNLVRETMTTPEAIRRRLDDVLHVINGIPRALTYAMPPWDPDTVQQIERQIQDIEQALKDVRVPLNALLEPPPKDWDPDSPYTRQTERAKKKRHVAAGIAGPNRQRRKTQPNTRRDSSLAGC